MTHMVTCEPTNAAMMKAPMANSMPIMWALIMANKSPDHVGGRG
jgi:hypothetical protein